MRLSFDAMLSKAVPSLRRSIQTLLSRPLTLRESAIAAALMLIVGTIYCQIYCFLAIPQRHWGPMPLFASVHRASVDIVPAFAVFELGKRLPLRTRIWAWIGLAALFAVAVAVAVAWRMQLHIMTAGLTPRRMAADRIPFMGLAATGIAYYSLRHRLVGRRSDRGRISDPIGAMPPPSSIEWVRAAGNYVEIQMGGRTRLLRMTLRQARRLLPAGEFIQIHRSVIVNRERIAAVKGKRRVEMIDGTAFTIGDAHRINLPIP